MLNSVISLSLRNRFLVVLFALALVGIGIRCAIVLPLDAFPDTTPNQVQINAVAPALAPEEVERQIAFPVELALGGLKGLQEVRSSSKFGLCQVVATFSDDTDIYFARQQIMERMEEVELPEGIDRPRLGPVATGLGEVYHYRLSSDVYDLMELRTLQDWVIRPRLRRVPGVAEVSAWGGLAKQFEVRHSPDKLAQHGLTLDDLLQALRENNKNEGGGNIVRAGIETLVQGIGRARDVADIEEIVVATHDGVPIRVKDLAEVKIGHMIRRGGVTAQGRGEVVLGQAFMRMGENSREVTMALDEALEDAKKALPAGVDVEVVYRRTDLVNNVLRTAGKNLFEGAILVIAILFAFLGNLRAGLIVASVIPLSMLFAVTMMERIGVAGSLLSLGAIDFGLVVDSSVVMVENCVRRLAHDRTTRPELDVVREAAIEVRKPTMFGELIIMVVYLPILTLEGIEGKLFRPMALTAVFALLGSMILSLTLMPVLTSLCLRRSMTDKPTRLDRLAHFVFQPLLRLSLRFPKTTLVVVGAITIAATLLGLRLGSEFVPRLEEEAIVITTIRLPGVSIAESVRYGTCIERILLEEFPDEIQQIASFAGSAEIANDQMGPEVTDVFVILKPRSQWTKARTQEELVEAMADVTDQLPGMRAAYSQPIEMRINEMDAGIRTDLGIKLFGDDLEVLKEKAAEIERIVREIPGAADVGTEQISGQTMLSVTAKRKALARYGVSARQVLDAVGTVGGLRVGEILEPERRFPLVVRLSPSQRHDPMELKHVLIATASGQRLPLELLADLRRDEGPATILREWGLRRIVVQANVRGRDLGSFVDEVKARLKDVSLPVGYTIEYGGQFKNLQRAERRLYLVVPLALALIFCLLYLTFYSIRDALMISTGVLFARVGGVLGLWVMGLPFTISAGVGFVALAGASILEGLVLVSAIRDRVAQGVSKREAIEEARLVRLRPVLMTGTVAVLGFVPMMVSTGIGAEVQRPLATVVVFGITCDTFLTMLALPVLYLLFGKGPAIDGTHVALETTGA
ncbi:MAG: efflux RND transporter permease subunit [Planctomycetia bacterium]|nr:efflux RND transporter permease subunit [Planctomycetia bacterium]